MAENCIFCSIVDGKIPCTKLLETEHALAFLDINPWSEGHSLIIPKAHYTLADECPPEVLAEVACQIPKLARAVSQAVCAAGYNILNNNGRAAGQIVDHLHFHIIPRQVDDRIIRHAPQSKYAEGQDQKIAELIRQELRPF